MKKLMVAAAVAAMTAGAFADICDDDAVDTCLAYDLKVKVATLGAKATKCTIAAEDVCDDDEVAKIYYFDDVSRTFKGYVWTCEYACGGEFDIAAWDTKSTQALAVGLVDTIALDEDSFFRYGKKANKVAADFALATDTADLRLAGTKGSFKATADSDYNFVKSISGKCAGKLAFTVPAAKAVVVKGSICDDDVIEPCEDVEVLVVGICDCFTSYCEDGSSFDDMVPAAGTWTLKYNKKASYGKLGKIRDLCPSYAF